MAGCLIGDAPARSRERRSQEVQSVPIAVGDSIRRHMLDGEVAAAVDDLLSKLFSGGCARGVNRQIDDLSWRFQLIRLPPAADEQHFADAGVLGHIDPLRIMRADDRVDMEIFREVLAGSRCRRVRRDRGR